MKKSLVVLLSFIASAAQAELAPEGLMYKGKSCAFYWAGDECTHYSVPKDWQVLYPDSKCKDNPKDKFCYKLKNRTCRGTAKKCCEYFGFEFVKMKLEPVIDTAPDECRARH